MSDYLAPDVEEHGSINIPNVEGSNFAIDPAILNMAASDRFGGTPTEDPNAHITKFLRLSGTFKMNGVTQNVVRLRLFPFTLKDMADDWILVDASSGGLFTILEPTQAEDLLEKISMNGSTWYTERSSQKLVGGIHEAEQLTALSTKIDNVVSMVQKLAQITVQKHNSFQPQGGYNPNNSRNHPDFSWSNRMGAVNPQHFVNRGPLGFQSTQVQSQLPTLEAPPQSNLEAIVEKILKSQLQSEESTRVTGKLPASTENPREHVNAIVTRSDKVLEEPSPPIKASIPNRTVEEEIQRILENVEVEPTIVKSNPQVIDEGKKPVRRYENPLPFPLQTQKQSRWKKFLEIVESLKASVPLLDLLSQVPSYGKFLKDILAKRRKYGELEMIAMAQEYRVLTPRVGRRVT
ncbi:PREDICTED: uncharacterized protein LOC109155287 [Ipomoea nil]|uniref:uncharacterized protein LOC109155287 n=1 Tax=Ipomoea nil TaxID=35883 RepID=UPI000900FA97|nr:PREDICTED: uncharacterized protein LOC109155287 [Ipomoea nil]